MADETATQPEVPADDREPPQPDGRAEGQKPSRWQKIKVGAAKAVLAVGNYLDSPVKNKVKDYGYKNNGQMIAGRGNKLFDHLLASIDKTTEAAAKAVAENKFEELIINVPVAIAEQLLAILDGLNNWIKNIERHPELGQIKDNENITGNISRPEKTGTQTQNLAKPERSDEPTKNLGNNGKTDSETQNIPTPTNSPEVNAPRPNKLSSNTPPANTPTITQKGKSTPPAGLNLDKVAAFFFNKTITVKNDAIASLNQSKAVQYIVKQVTQLGNMLAAAKNKNKPRTSTPNRGLTLGDRTASKA